MKRLLAILILVASCQGCMMFDDLAYYDGPPPQPACGMPVAQIQQTAEPPLR
jgi:hypothetical protein